MKGKKRTRTGLKFGFFPNQKSVIPVAHVHFKHSTRQTRYAHIFIENTPRYIFFKGKLRIVCVVCFHLRKSKGAWAQRCLLFTHKHHLWATRQPLWQSAGRSRAWAHGGQADGPFPTCTLMLFKLFTTFMHFPNKENTPPRGALTPFCMWISDILLRGDNSKVICRESVSH